MFWRIFSLSIVLFCYYGQGENDSAFSSSISMIVVTIGIVLSAKKARDDEKTNLRRSASEMFRRKY